MASNRATRQMTDTTPSYERLVENAPVGVFQVIVDQERIDDVERDKDHLYVNETLADLLGFDSTEHFYAETDSIEYADPSDRAAFLERLQEKGQAEAFETTLITNNGEPVDVLLTGTLEDGDLTGYVTDISDQKRLERKAQEQAEAILELSVPIVQIWEGVTLATVIGTLDTDRAQRLTEDLLTEIADSESEVALIDITGVPSIDTATAQHLIDTVNAVTLLGSDVIITGINPEIAQTLVHLGLSMNDTMTKSSLSEGLKLALDLLDKNITSELEAVE